jgi:hypothetical protein
MGFCEEVVDEAVDECVLVWSRPLQAELESALTRRHRIGPGTKAALAAWIICRHPWQAGVVHEMGLLKEDRGGTAAKARHSTAQGWCKPAPVISESGGAR